MASVGGIQIGGLHYWLSVEISFAKKSTSILTDLDSPASSLTP